MDQGAELKVIRGRFHLSELRNACSAFVETTPYEIAQRQEGARVLHFVNRADPIPLNIPLILGDAIHNLRSALDLVICQLVADNGSSVTERTGFPIVKSAEGLANAMRQVDGAPDGVADYVRRFHPYKGGNDLLWWLHRLDIADKHRLLLIVGAAYRSVVLRFDPGVMFRDFANASEIQPIDVVLRPADRAFPIGVGTSLFSDLADSEGMGAPVGFNFDLAFGEGEVIAGAALFPTLDWIANLVEYAVRTLQELRPDR